MARNNGNGNGGCGNGNGGNGVGKKSKSKRNKRKRNNKRNGNFAKNTNANGGVTMAPTAISRTLSKTNPVSTYGSSGRRIVNREFVQAINGSIAFEVDSLAVNPGVAATFPWLSTQADGWEQYKFNKLAFHYVSSTASTTVGRVIMAPDYDATDPAPASRAAICTYQDAVVSSAWTESRCTLNPSSMFPTGPRKFIRTGLTSGSQKLYDAANLHLATVGEVGTDEIGELWVEYDIDLFIPQTIAAADEAEVTSVYDVHTADQTLATTVSEPVAWEVISDGLGLGAPATGVFTLPKGAYVLSGEVSFQDSAAELLTAVLMMYKNGADTTPNQRSSLKMTMDAAGYVAVPFTFYVVVNGTDTIQLQAVMTGAAGTLTLRNLNCHMMIVVA